ncbi:MAG TPA: hypothetical protein VF810_02475 [Patescibacteria group bacterium]
MQNVFNNSWIVGIGVAVISGLILYYIFRIGKSDKSSRRELDCEIKSKWKRDYFG